MNGTRRWAWKEMKRKRKMLNALCSRNFGWGSVNDQNNIPNIQRCERVYAKYGMMMMVWHVVLSN